MDYLVTYLEFGSESLYAYIPLVGIIYVLAYFYKKIFTSGPSAGTITTVLTIALMLVLPALPMYLFERKINKMFEYQSEHTLAYSSSIGLIYQPYTLINPPTTYFHYIAPQSAMLSGRAYDYSSPIKNYSSLRFQYGEQPITEMVEVECDIKKISIAKPVNGTFMSPREAVDINPFEEKLYCENDYSKNWDIVNCKIKFALDNGLLNSVEKFEKMANEMDIECRI